MEQTDFQYRPTVKKIYYILLVVTLLSLVVVFRVNLVRFSSETYISTTVQLLLASAVPFSVLFRLLFFVRPIIFSKYSLQPPFLYIKFGRKEKKVDLNEVQKLKFTLFSPRFFGGFRIEMPTGEKYRFLSFLQNNHKVVEFLAKNKPELLPEAKFNKYILTSRCVLVSWRRMLWRLKKVLFVLIKFFMLPSLFFFYTYKHIDLQSSPEFTEHERLVVMYLAFLLINFKLAGFINYFEEKILNSKIFSKTDDELKAWDFKQESSIFYSFQFLFFLSSVGLFVLLTRLFISLFGLN